MATLSEKIQMLMDHRGLKAKELANLTSIPYTTLLDIIKGKTTKLDIVKGIALANTLECEVDFLVDDSLGINDYIPKNREIELSQKDKVDISKEIEKMKSQLLNSEGLLFDGEPASDEAINSILSALEVGMEIAKKRNKEKFTPNKYKK